MIMTTSHIEHQKWDQQQQTPSKPQCRLFFPHYRDVLFVVTETVGFTDNIIKNRYFGSLQKNYWGTHSLPNNALYVHWYMKVLCCSMTYATTMLPYAVTLKAESIICFHCDYTDQHHFLHVYIRFPKCSPNHITLYRPCSHFPQRVIIK